VSGLWTVIVALTLATVAIRAVGPVLFGGRELPPRIAATVALLAPAVLAALVITSAFADGAKLSFDPARTLAIGAAAVALALRSPLLVAVVAAGATAALVRALA